MKVQIIGAGFAGVEAAFQIANANIPVVLYEMKPKSFSPAHESAYFAELVCSNSFKAKRIASASGLMKTEMVHFDAACVKTAYENEVPAGGALAVDRNAFSKAITEKVENHPLITVVHEEVKEIPQDGITIIAAGPLASNALANSIEKLVGKRLSFYDAAAPIITDESVDKMQAFFQSRYDRGETTDYLNCPLNKEEYEAFYEALITARTADLHELDQNKKVYEGCMPIEVLAKRGEDTMRFGPMKPVGLTNPNTDKRPWAVVQLRKETASGTLYNMVGFQTNLAFPEQKRVFSMIPALKNADFVRYGVMHRNTFIDSPRLLLPSFRMKAHENIYFAGQISGVEGYMESAMSGILAGINVVRQINKEDPLILPETTMMGALSRYISNESVMDFQPMGANFGIIPPLAEHIRSKQERYAALAQRAMQDLENSTKR